MARVNPREARTIGDGYSASLSADGTWLAYLHASNLPAKSALVVRNLHNSVSTSLTDNAALPIYSPSPVGWAGPMTAWTHAGADLFFVDQADAMAIRRYRTAEPQSAAAPPLVKATGPGEWIRDLRLSPDDRELGFLSITKEGVSVTDPESRQRRGAAGREPGSTRQPAAISTVFSTATSFWCAG